MTTVGVQYINVQETIRHNRAMENLENLGLDVKRGELDVKRGELSVKQGTLAETIRFNNISAAQQEYANQTARITAEANARNAETNAKRLALDTYMYNDTGRALASAQAANYASSAMLNSAKQTEQDRRNQLDMAYWQRSSEQAKASNQVAQGAANSAKADTERSKTSSGVISAVGTGIRGLATLLKLGF